MPAAASRLNPRSNGGKPQGARGNALPMVPFTAAAHEHTEQAFDKTVEFTEATQQLGPFDIPAYGYFRHLLLNVETVTPGE